MKNLLSTLVIATVVLISALPAMAQRKRVSPHETFSSVIDGGRLTITYGRPYRTKPGTTEVRTIWGGLVPYGEPWRMGADEATTLITQRPLLLGGKTIPAGAYTLYMVPVENGPSQLAVSTTLGGWGIPVDTNHDVVRVDLQKGPLGQTAEQFTMELSKVAAGGGELTLMWENTMFTVPFIVEK